MNSAATSNEEFAEPHNPDVSCDNSTRSDRGTHWL
jgi:hypothetical protein